MHALLMEGVGFAWGTGGFGLRIDRLALPPGRRVLLTGPSGAGKSTLLSLAAGLVAPARGRVAVEGTDLAALRGPARDRLRAERLGVLFQMFNLVPYLSARDNVLLPLHFAPERRRRAGDAAAEASRLMGALGLDGALHARRASALSVGQQQRVAAARALVGRPALILADEPTSALDPDRREAFLALLFAEAERAGAAAIVVSHERGLDALFDETLRLADVAVAQGGA